MDDKIFDYLLKRLKKSPHLAIPALIALFRGWFYKIKYRLFFKNVHIGKYFRVYGTLIITGPGSVQFGNNCIIISNAIKPVCIRTLTPQATVILEDHCGLNGTSIQCAEQILIGQLSNIADAYITDSSSHSLGKHRRFESIDDIQARPVYIERNVWVSVNVVINAGVTLGENSVIGACSLVLKDVPPNVFAAGNPLKIIKPIE